MWALSPNMPFTPPLVAGAGGFFAPYCRAYIARTGVPAAHRPDDRRQRARQRGPQRVRAPARADDGRGRDELARCCGTRSATSRPARRPTARSRWSSRTRSTRRRDRASPRGSRARASYAEAMWVPGRDQVSPRAGQGLRQARLRPGRHHRSVEARSTPPRSTCPFAWFEAMWLENLGFCDDGRGLEGRRSRRAEVRRAPADQPVGRRAVHQPDRRLGHAAPRRGRAPGDGPRRRAPGRGRQDRARPRLRRRRAVLRDVGRRLDAAPELSTDVRTRSPLREARRHRRRHHEPSRGAQRHQHRDALPPRRRLAGRQRRRERPRRDPDAAPATRPSAPAPTSTGSSA